MYLGDLRKRIKEVEAARQSPQADFGKMFGGRSPTRKDSALQPNVSSQQSHYCHEQAEPSLLTASMVMPAGGKNCLAMGSLPMVGKYREEPKPHACRAGSLHDA